MYKGVVRIIFCRRPGVCGNNLRIAGDGDTVVELLVK